MKRALEGAPVTDKTRLHLDRCLTCRACETTCPSGVRYGRLVDIGRAYVEKHTRRSAWDRLKRAALSFGLARTELFAAALRLGQLVGMAPESSRAGAWPAPRHAKKMVVLRGCVQPALAPSINAAAARVLDRIGVSLVEVPGAGCCGALRFHLNYQEAGRDDMRALIDAWWPLVAGREVEAIVATASGCGVTIKDYAHMLAIDANYRGKAERVSELARDLCEVIRPEDLPRKEKRGRIVFQAPCSLQHGQQIRGKAEALLERVGYELAPVRDAHLCCGSAGTYSLLQPAIAAELRTRKLAALEQGTPQAIATANIGCLAHLAGATATPVRHWIELVDEALA
jgi:glycolate oxidase iron-sulfur subunit